MPDSSVRRGRVPAEWLNIAGIAAAFAFVAAAGTGLASVLPEPSPWLMAGAYLGPAALAFTAYWWIAQRG